MVRNHSYSRKNSVLLLFLLSVFSFFTSTTICSTTNLVTESKKINNYIKNSESSLKQETKVKERLNHIPLDIKERTSDQKDFLTSTQGLSEVHQDSSFSDYIKSEVSGDQNLSTDLGYSTFSLFIAGFGDKSFFISTIASVNYNKWVSVLGSFIGLVMMGILSLFLGIEISQFIPLWVIDFAGSTLFIIMGIKMIIDALDTSEDEHFMKKKEENNEQKNIDIEKILNYKKCDYHMPKEYDEADEETKNCTLEKSQDDIRRLNEGIIFDIGCSTDEEEVLKQSSTILQKEFEDQFNYNKMLFEKSDNNKMNNSNKSENNKFYIKSEDTKNYVNHELLDNVKNLSKSNIIIKFNFFFLIILISIH
jgi:putative Ca2+/H+ antiporter (TMEM165/GDT1 family)